MSNNYEWKRLADLPVDGVYLHCQQTINGYVYVYSGRTKTGLMDDNFYKYSVELNSWEIIQPVGTKPEQRAGATSWVIDGKFYIYGGLGSSNKVLTDLWVYTPVSNSWNRLSDNVRHGTYAQSVVRNNKAIVFGGRTNLALQTDTLFVSEYNPINGLWTDLPHNTESRILNSVSIDKNNNILLYGGVRKENGTSYNGLDSVTVYKENNTTTSSSHSPGRYGQTCFYNDTTDKFYFFGGLDSSRNPLITDNFVEYDNINSWTEIPNSPIARIYSGVSSINEEFIITGGAIGTDVADNRTNEVWAYVKKEEEKPKGWKKLKNLPVKLDMHKQATIGDDIYIFGGRTEGNITVDTLYKYNIPSDTWSQIPKSGTWPNVKYGHVMTAINGKLYVTGGFTGSAYDNTTWEFDPSTNKWSAKTSMPVFKYQATAGVINDEMIVIGGSSGSAALQNTNYAYNPTNNTWRNYTPSQSFARLGPASAVVNDSLYLYGGSDASGAVQTATLHVIENAIISQKEDHEPARWYHAGVKYKDNMYSLFGYTNQAQTIEAPCEEYNTLTETWTIVPDSPSKRRLAAASTISNGFIVTGGSVVSGQFLDEVWAYIETEETPPEKEYTITWKKGADIPVTSLQHHASASVGNDVYVFGGRKNGGALVNVTNDLWKYSTEDDTWELLTTPSPKPSPRNGHKMVSINHLLYVIGGVDVNGQRSNETWEYNTLTNVWTQKQNFVNNSPNASAVIRNGKIVVVSSISNASMTVEEYDPSTDTWSTITSFGNSNAIPDNPFGLAIDNDNFIWICGGRKPSPIPAPTNTYVITPDNQLVDMGSHPPPRDFNAATFFNGKYYTYGGGQSNVYSATLNNSRFESFNRMTNEWENLSEDSPILRDIFGSTMSGNKFVVTGGRFLQSGSPVYTNETWICEWVEVIEPEPEPEYVIKWRRGADLQVALSGSVSSSVGNYLYVFGGYDGTNDNSNFYRYDISADNWDVINQPSIKPSSRVQSSMVAIKGKLYLFGGTTRNPNGSRAATNELWEYVPETNVWVQKASHELASYAHRAFVRNDKMVVIGYHVSGSGSGDVCPVREYNPETNTWVNLPSTQNNRRNFAGSVLDNGDIIVYGGHNPSQGSDTMQIFRANNTWVIESPHQPIRANNNGSFQKGRFYTYGGSALDVVEPNRFESYDPVEKTWENNSEGSPTNRYSFSMSDFDNGFIVNGGQKLGETGLTKETWICEWVEKEEVKTYSWKRRPDIPVGGDANQLRFSAGATIGDDFYVFGGMLLDSTNTPSYTNRLWKYNTISKSWVEIQQQSVRPSVRNSHSMVSLNGKLYVYGGYTGTGASVNGQMWEYTPETNTWIVLATGINSIKHTMFVKNGKIYTSGGTTDNSTSGVINTLREFDPNLNEWRIVETNNGIYGRISATSSYNENFNVTYSGTIGSSIYLKTGFIIDSVVEEISSNYNGVVFACSGIIDDTFYVFGGNNNTESYPFISYELTSDTWKVIEDINTPPSRAGAAYSNIENGFILAGCGSSTMGLEVWEYSLDDGDDPDPPEPEEWGYTEHTETTEVIVPERARYMRTVAVGSGGQGHGSGGGALTAGYVPVTPGETLWIEINNNYSIVSAIRDGGKKVVIGASAAVYSLGGLKWSESNHLLTFNPLHYAIITSEWAGSNAVSAEVSRSCINTGTNRVRYWVGGAAAGYNADGNLSSTNGGRNGSVGDVGCVNGYYNYRGDGGGGVGLNGDVDSPRTPAGRGRGGSGGEDGVAYNSTPNSGKGGKYGGGNGSGYTTPTNNGGISIKWLSNYDVDETFNDSKVSVSYNNDDEIIDYQSSFDESLIDVSDFENPLSDNNNLKIDVSDYETPVGIYGNSGKITQVVKEKSRGRKVNHSTVDVSEHGDLQIRTNEAYLEISDEHEGFTNIYNKSIVTLSDKGELQIKSNYMWAEVSFNGIKYSKEFRLRETTPNTVTLSPIYDVEYDFIGIYPSDDTYDCEVFVNGVLQEKGEGKYFTLLLGDTIQFRITSPNPGEVKFVAINGDNILNIICPSKYGNYPDFLDFGEFTETFPNFWYETGELIIDGLYPLDSYSEIYVNNVRVWMVVNDGEPTNRVSVTNGDRIKLVFKGSSPTELPEGETYKIYHDNDRGTYDVGQVVVKSIVVEGSETRQDIKFFIDMIILKTVTERQQLLLDSDYNHYQRTNHDSKNDFVLDSQHGIHEQDVSYIWDYTSIYENEVEYIWDKTSIYENTPNEYIFNITKILENIPNEYILDKTSIFESEEQSYDLNEYPSYIFDEYDTDVINSLRIPIGTDFGKNVSDIKFEIDTSGFIDNNKAQYDIDNEYDMHTQSIKYEIDNIYETVSGKDGNIHINAVEWIRNVKDISILIDQVHEYYDLGIHNLVDSVYENNTTISKIYIDADYVHFTYNQYYFEGSYTHILQAVYVPIDAVYDTNQTERWPTEAQEWEVVKVQYPVYADMVYYHLVKYNPYHIIDTDFQIYIHTESKDVSSEYEEGTQHNNYKIDIITDKGTSFVGYNFSGLYEKTEYNYHPVVTDKSLLVIGNSQTSVDGNDFEFVRDPVWQTDLIENLSGWHTREKAIEYAQSLNLSEEEIDLFEYEGRWGFTTDPELVVRDCSLPYPIIMIDKVIFWSH